MTAHRFGVVLQGVDPPAEFHAAVKRIDGAGYDHLWLTDSSLHARDPFAYLTLAAGVSSTLVLGTAVTNPRTRHPAVIAVSAATLDEVSGGRAILGIGAGDRPLEALGIKPAPLQQLCDSVDAIRRLLAGETVDHDGPGFRLVGAHLRFTARADIPIFVSASGPRTLAAAGGLADGVILLCGLAPEVVRWALSRIQQGADDAGRPRPHVAIFAYGSIDEDEDRALAAAAPIAAWFPQTVPEYCRLAGLDPAIVERVRGSYTGGEFQEATGAASMLPAEFVRKMALAGGRGRVTAQLQMLRDLGVDSVHLFPLGDDRFATIDAFADCWERSGR